MRRDIHNELIRWKNSPYRRPLVLQGARQVGKTWSLSEFGKDQYDTVAYLNFETNPRLNETFAEDLDPSYLLPLLSREAGVSIVPERTLIILDEVQLCERALTSLKYFCERAGRYHVIAAGSLLGVAVNRREFSFPVGKVDIKTMHPLGMGEFLEALGEGELAAAIRDSFEKNAPLPAVLHEAALTRYREYLAVGGMPDCVSKYAATGDMVLVRHIQDTILESYLNDMSKYNKAADIKKCRQVYDVITVQLSQKNTRFQYKLIKKGGRAAEFENAIEWLCLSGIVTRVYNVEQAQKPLENFRNIDAFKMYVSDTGLLCAKKEIVPRDVMLPGSGGRDELALFKGGLTENYVCGQLRIKGIKSYYWTSEYSAEVDFIAQLDSKIIPIEVKSASNAKAKSLDVYMRTYRPEYAVKLCGRNFGFENTIKTIPLYAAWLLGG
jgi:predicted AAA+ superfamily ATPase